LIPVVLSSIWRIDFIPAANAALTSLGLLKEPTRPNGLDTLLKPEKEFSATLPGAVFSPPIAAATSVLTLENVCFADVGLTVAGEDSFLLHEIPIRLRQKMRATSLMGFIVHLGFVCIYLSQSTNFIRRRSIG
jgi:hypothetical protein